MTKKTMKMMKMMKLETKMKKKSTKTPPLQKSTLTASPSHLMP